MTDIIGIIPARYSSSRFPGKPLAMILGKTLIQRTYENACLSSTLKKILIATDDERIYEHALSFGADVVMTSPYCLNGTDRLAEVLRHTPALSKTEIVINIQGDEPCVPPDIIDSLARTLESDPSAVMSTPIARIHSEQEAINRSVVKCVIDKKGYALYFSRSLIPAGHQANYDPNINYFRHIGLYGYRRDFLLHYAQLSPTPLQLAEDLEQLKVLEYGYKIKTALVNYTGMDVNTPEDIQRVEHILCKQNIYLSQAESVLR